MIDWEQIEFDFDDEPTVQRIPRGNRYSHEEFSARNARNEKNQHREKRRSAERDQLNLY